LPAMIQVTEAPPESLRTADVVRRATRYLERRGVQSPSSTAELLLASVLGTDRSELYRRQGGLSAAQAKLFGRALCRTCTGTPVQHITGETGFRRLVLDVRPGVFVPRPETEVLVEVALRAVGGTGVVADVGTGTGAVALSMKDERPDLRVIATDSSPEAVLLARQNSVTLNIEVEVLHGDLLAPLSDELRGALDAVVSNPPYVAQESAASLPSDVLADPPAALFGDIGTYRRLFAVAIDWLRPGGAVVVEIDPDLLSGVLDEAGMAGFVSLAVDQDLTGRDRVVSGRKPAGSGT
jgi:release factor glutamine methyltransferase